MLRETTHGAAVWVLSGGNFIPREMCITAQGNFETFPVFLLADLFKNIKLISIFAGMRFTMRNHIRGLKRPATHPPDSFIQEFLVLLFT